MLGDRKQADLDVIRDPETGASRVWLDGTDITDHLDSLVVEMTPQGTKAHLVTGADLKGLGVRVDDVVQVVERPSPEVEVGLKLLELDEAGWDAVVGGRPSFGEGSNPGAKILKLIEQLERELRPGG